MFEEHNLTYKFYADLFECSTNDKHSTDKQTDVDFGILTSILICKILRTKFLTTVVELSIINLNTNISQVDIALISTYNKYIGIFQV